AGVAPADGGGASLVEQPGAAAQRRKDVHAGREEVRHIDFAAGIQRDAEWPGQAGVAAGDGSGGSLVEQPGAAAQRRIYKHAIGGSIRHVDFAAGVQRDAFWIRQVGVAPADSGGGSLVEQTGAAAHRRIDKHAARAKTAKSVIRYIDFAAGIQRNACWVAQAGVAPADGGGGNLVEQTGAAAHRRIDKHAARAKTAKSVIRYIDFAAGIQRNACWVGQAGVAPADGGGGNLVEQTGAAAHRRIDKHAARAKTAKSVIRYIDFAAGIQRNACWVPQAGVAPADGGDGRSIAVAPLGVNSDG